VTQVDRSERLINLVALLRATPKALPLDDIVHRVPGYPEKKESYRRQFERDKDELRGIGIPIVLERVDADAYDDRDGISSVVDGYRIPREEYELPDLGLTDAERTALNVAFAAVRMPGGPGREAMWKLGGGGAGDDGDAAPALAAIPALDALGPLLRAVRERALVEFRYKEQNRTVEPYGLIFRRGHWYLVGHDRTRDQPRAFRVDRIAGDVRAGEPDAFAPFAGDPASLLADDPLRFPDDEPVVAVVRVDATHAGEARASFPEAKEQPAPNGATDFELTVTNRDAFRGAVLDLLDAAEVVAPADLRAEVVAWLQSMRTSTS
jgi:predicted DNA-binding transcriptional regulator YafY